MVGGAAWSTTSRPRLTSSHSSPYAYNPAYIPSALLNNANTPSSSDSNASELKTSASAISGGAGVGIGIAAVLGVELLALLIWVLFRRKTRGSSIHSRTTKSEHVYRRDRFRALANLFPHSVNDLVR